MVEINAIKEYIEEFNNASGKVINNEKCELYFSANTLKQFKSMVQGSLSIKYSQILGNYLGLPLSIYR